ncbi:MAG TPA: aldehyde dehydrogenase family protein, partial [Aestuariivirgaceae bacterium]|nr:aldehyde dehydrogenase family protein [Aestuariivirgaceae bacterium]
MSDVIKCISPVDGSVFAERPVASEKAVAETFRKARAAQGEWSRLPTPERAKYCSAAVDAMLGMTDEIVPELAWQMGRPVRFGAGEMKGFAERARYMIDIAERSLEPIDP